MRRWWPPHPPPSVDTRARARVASWWEFHRCQSRRGGQTPPPTATPDGAPGGSPCPGSGEGPQLPTSGTRCDGGPRCRSVPRVIPLPERSAS
ncbi:hypothetical protein FTX61_15710 [Nitriliruptoraceae bacterium ZYF776]|nr:hypothetical protein [Profundirhabdus halotolerans]